MTAVIAVSAAGHKSPPFFIVEGKRVMSNWLLPLDKDSFSSLPIDLQRHTDSEWFTSTGVIVCSEKGSMTGALLEHFMRHLNNFVRTIVPPGLAYCVSLDGHKSRCAFGWLDFCKKNSIEVVQTPANTSHFLQPCDADVNRTFKRNTPSVRDSICKCALVDTKAIQFKLICGIAAWNRVTINDIKKSFEVTGTWPVNYRFMQFFESRERSIPGSEALKDQDGTNSDQGSTSKSPDQSVEQRMADNVIFLKIKSIVEGDSLPERKLQKIAQELASNPSTNAILMQHQKPRPVPKSEAPQNYVLSAGAPAEVLTVGEALKKREKRVQEEKIKSGDRKRRKKERIKKANEKDAKKRKISSKTEAPRQSKRRRRKA